MHFVLGKNNNEYDWIYNISNNSNDYVCVHIDSYGVHIFNDIFVNSCIYTPKGKYTLPRAYIHPL